MTRRKRSEANDKLERLQEKLQRHVSMIEALAVFLNKHPYLADRSDVKELQGGKLGIEVDEKALIVPMRKGEVRLRLSRKADSYNDVPSKVICESVGKLSAIRFKAMLFEAGVDLSKPADCDEDEEEED